MSKGGTKTSTSTTEIPEPYRRFAENQLAAAGTVGESRGRLPGTPQDLSHRAICPLIRTPTKTRWSRALSPTSTGRARWRCRA